MADYQELLRHKKEFQQEIIKAIRCTTKKQKKALLADWNQKYCPHHIKTMLNVLQKREVAYKIMDWKL
jgi:hypothetical protein